MINVTYHTKVLKWKLLKITDVNNKKIALFLQVTLEDR